jgi:hypothetical protein
MKPSAAKWLHGCKRLRLALALVKINSVSKGLVWTWSSLAANQSEISEEGHSTHMRRERTWLPLIYLDKERDSSVKK